MGPPNRFSVQTPDVFSNRFLTSPTTFSGSSGYYDFIKLALPDTSQFDERAFPLVVAIFTFVALVVQATVCALSRPFKPQEQEESVAIVRQQPGLYNKFVRHVQSYGGPIIYSCFVVRCAIVLTLVYLSGTTLQQCMSEPQTPQGGWLLRCPGSFLGLTFVRDSPFLLLSWLTGSQIYSSILSLLVLASKSWHVSLTRANTLVLLSALAVYAYRDLWPLAKYDEHPVDAAEGRLLYAKIALLACSALFIPLCMPRPYIPVDPLVSF